MNNIRYHHCTAQMDEWFDARFRKADVRKVAEQLKKFLRMKELYEQLYASQDEKFTLSISNQWDERFSLCENEFSSETYISEKIFKDMPFEVEEGFNYYIHLFLDKLERKGITVTDCAAQFTEQLEKGVIILSLKMKI